jgi:universal stress protein A
MTIHRVLFPIDFSNQSLEALDYASQLAASSHAELHFAYIDDLSRLTAVTPYCCQSFVPAVDRSALESALNRLKPTVSGVNAVYHYVEGVPAAAICNLATAASIDLIVMSSHGRTGLSHLLLGSVAEEVMRRAPCPVFVVKHRTSEFTGSAGEEIASHVGCETAPI